nr:MAG TPA: hypothetical protein [Caudoviricetes sp.]
MYKVVFEPGSVPVSVVARVYGKDASYGLRRRWYDV